METKPSSLHDLSLRDVWPVIALVIIVAVVTGVYVWGGRESDASDSKVGQVFDSPFVFGDNDHATVAQLEIPFAGLTIATTPPMQEAPVNGDGAHRVAPEGGSLIGVSIDVTPRTLLANLLPTDKPAFTPTPRVTLVVGDRTYPVPAGRQAAATELPAARLALVAVAGSPRSVSVAVTYDGVTQTVDTASDKRSTGRAGPLYSLADPALTQAGQCGTPTLSDGFRARSSLGIECTVRAIGSLPYLPGHGWAQSGRAWYAVSVAVDPYARFTRGNTDYRAALSGRETTSTYSATVGGAKVGPSYTSPGYQGDLLAFDVPAHSNPEVTIVTTYRDLVRFGETKGGTVTRGPDVRVTWKAQS